MPEVAIRFAVGDGVSRTAASWKCWTRLDSGKNDVYLTCRELGGALKASLHETGRWHVAFFSEFLVAQAQRDEWSTRVVANWERPNENYPGLTLAYRIVTSLAAVSRPLKGRRVKNLIWIAPPPSAELAVEVDVVFTTQQWPTGDWPGRLAMATKVVGRFALDGGETVWLVHRLTPMPKLSGKSVRKRFFGGHSESDLSGEGLRAILFGEAKDRSRIMYDVPVRYTPEKNDA